MKRKIAALFLAAAVAVTALAGCGGGSDSTDNTTAEDAAGEDAVADEVEDGDNNTSDDEDAGEAAADGEVDVNEDGTVNNPEDVVVDENKLTFWSLFAGGDGEYMDQIIEEYNGSSPTKEVQSVMLVWADYYTKLQTAVAANKGPDIGVSHAAKLSELVEQGAVIAIDDYLDELEIDLADIYGAANIDSVTFDGSVYAIPLDTHCEIMYFNNELLAEAGVEPGADGQYEISSKEDLYEICEKLKETLPEGYSPISLTNSNDDPYRTWWATYFQMGGTPFLSDDGTEVTMDKEIAADAAEFVAELYTNEYVLEGIDDHQAFFQGGKAGILIGGTWLVGALENTDGLDFVAQSYPQMFDEDHCFGDSHTFVIPFNKDRTEEETLAAIEFAVAASGDGGATWAQSGQIPANYHVLESDEYKNLEHRSNYMDELDKVVLAPQVSTFYAMQSDIMESLNYCWLGQATPEETAESIYNDFESNLP